MIMTTRCVGLYHQQLSYCIVQYIEKDPNTAIAVLRGLFKYWPWSSASKQVRTCRGEKRSGEVEERRKGGVHLHVCVPHLCARVLQG